MNKDKICKNCEYYKCERSIKNGVLGASVDCRYSKENKCIAYKDRVIASPDCHCNCGKFKLWYAIEMQNQKEQDQRNFKKEETKRARVTPTVNYDSTRSYSSEEIHRILNHNAAERVKAEPVIKQTKERKKISVAGIALIIVGAIASLFNLAFLGFINDAIDIAKELEGTSHSEELATLQATSTGFTIFLVLSLGLTLAGVITVIKSKKK